MASAKEKTLALLSSTSSVNLQAGAGATTLYTVPTGHTCRISHVCIRDITASLAGGTDFDFTNWRQTVDLSAITTANTQYIILDGNNAAYTELAAAATFQITPSTGATAAATATIEVFGYLT